MYKKSPCKLITKGSCDNRLSDEPAILMDFIPFLANVWLAHGTYFSGVWSRFMTRLSGILYFLQASQCHEPLAPSGMVIFPVSLFALQIPFFLKILLGQEDESRSICPKFSFGFRAHNALVTAMVDVMSPLRLQTARRKFYKQGFPFM